MITSRLYSCFAPNIGHLLSNFFMKHFFFFNSNPEPIYLLDFHAIWLFDERNSFFTSKTLQTLISQCYKYWNYLTYQKKKIYNYIPKKKFVMQATKLITCKLLAHLFSASNLLEVKSIFVACSRISRQSL